MSKSESIKQLNIDYVMKILESLDDDLAAQAVLSAISLNSEHLIKMLIITSDVTYYRNMIRDTKTIKSSGGKEELTSDEIKRLLQLDGWKL